MIRRTTLISSTVKDGSPGRAMFATSTAVLYHGQKVPSGLYECLYFTGTGMDLIYSKTGCERLITVVVNTGDAGPP